RHSHDRLRASVEPLGPDQLTQRSYPSEWTIAQVLSHLGSQAEIFGLMLEAGLAGREPPGREEFPPIWDKWNAKDPQAQAADVLVALDPAATLAPDAVALLIDTVDQVAGRSAKPDGQQRKVRVSTTDPERRFILETGQAVTLTPADGDAAPEPGVAELRLPAE